MLAGHKCPIKCKWHLRGWTGSVHLSVDENSIHFALSNQLDVACCAITAPVVYWVRVLGPQGRGVGGTQAQRFNIPCRKGKQTTTKRCKQLQDDSKVLQRVTKKCSKQIQNQVQNRCKKIDNDHNPLQCLQSQNDYKWDPVKASQGASPPCRMKRLYRVGHVAKNSTSMLKWSVSSVTKN